MNRKLEHNHLIDGKYLKEDVIPELRQNLEGIIEAYVCRQAYFAAVADLNKALDQFEDECVAYDRSRS
jgi:DNA-binding FadR family transcriptional regulator